MIRVAVAGGFDPINGRGHISHILKAMELGDWLIIMLMTDEQLILKKRYTFYPDYRDRKCILEEIIKNRGEVVMMIDKGTTTCVNTLRLLKPDIFAKGGDRTPVNMPQSEIEVCREIGCKIVYEVGDEKIQSSSGLVEAVRR